MLAIKLKELDLQLKKQIMMRSFFISGLWS